MRRANVIDEYFARYSEIIELAQKITKSGDASDIAHEVLILISEQKAATLKDVLKRGKFREYVGRLIWNYYFPDGSRWKRKNRKALPLADYDEPITIDPKIIYREKIDREFRRLPRLEREFFMAHYEKAVSVKELARCSSVKAGTIYSILTRAKKTVINGLTQDCVVC